MPTLAQVRARSNALWLRQVAAHYGVPVVVMARQLRTSRALADEVGALLNEIAEREARALVSDDKRPPTDSDLYSELVRRHHAVLFEAHKKQANQQARRELAAEMRAQKQEKKGA